MSNKRSGVAAARKGAKSRDTRPARKRYWMSGRLADRKIRRLMQSNGMTHKEAAEHWKMVRVHYSGGF